MPNHLHRARVHRKLFHNLQRILAHEHEFAMATLSAVPDARDNILVVRTKDRVRLWVQRCQLRFHRYRLLE